MTTFTLRQNVLALAGAALVSAAATLPAEAQYYPRRHHGGEALAGGVLGGVIGGLAAGAIIHSARPAPVYVEPAPVYTRPRVHYRHVEAYPDVEYVPACAMQRQRVWVDQYTWTHRYVRVCD
jgi:hypothetical protein